MKDGEMHLREGDVLLIGEYRFTVVGWTARGKVRLSAPHLKRERTGWWSYPSDIRGVRGMEREGKRLW